MVGWTPARKQRVNQRTKYRTAPQLPKGIARAFCATETYLLRLLLAITILFTSPSLLARSNGQQIAPLPLAESATTTAPLGGGGSGNFPCTDSAQTSAQLITKSKGVSAYAQHSRHEIPTNKSILVVVADRYGTEQYTKVQVTGRQGSALTVADCLDRLSPGTYLVLATSEESLQYQTIFLPATNK